MELATWLSVLILGPGSVAVFVWFLYDVKRIFGTERPTDETTRHSEEATREVFLRRDDTSRASKEIGDH